MRVLSIVAAAVLGLGMSACAGGAGPVMSAAQFQRDYPASVAGLAPGDKLHVALYGDESFVGDPVVSAQGIIVLPLIGAIDVTGKTPAELQTVIEAKLADGFYKNPRVLVQVTDLQPIYVLGEVNKPGSFAFVPDMTLNKAAALAGGYTYRANTRAIAVRRSGTSAEVKVEADPALMLAPGDTVRILERNF